MICLYKDVELKQILTTLPDLVMSNDLVKSVNE